MRVLFDIGGTNTRVGISETGQRIDSKVVFPTPESFEDGIREIKAHVFELTTDRNASLVVGGIAGPLDREKSRIIKPGNLPGWRDKPLRLSLEHLFNAVSILENDTTLVGLGESTFGAGRGHEIVAYMNFGSGYGATRIVGGKPDVAASGFEPAFQIASYRDRVEFLPSDYIRYHLSGARFKNKYGSNPEQITDNKTWEKIERWMAVGIHNTLVFWSPHCVVLGGSVLKGARLDRVLRHLDELDNPFLERPVFKEAELGDFGGLYGALSLSNAHDFT